MLEYILSENDRLNKLISSLLDCARPRPPQFKPHHLHAIARRVTDLLNLQARRKSLHIHAEFAAPNDLLYCDEEQILQVLLNLVMNAVQILPPGGEITLRSHALKTGLALDVDDNGPGIAEDDRPKVFDPFFTQREGGIGLGLTVVQQIIRAHGAEITALASPSGGALPHFFPRQRNTGTRRHLHMTTRRVLIVDDEPRCSASWKSCSPKWATNPCWPQRPGSFGKDTGGFR